MKEDVVRGYKTRYISARTINCICKFMYICVCEFVGRKWSLVGEGI